MEDATIRDTIEPRGRKHQRMIVNQRGNKINGSAPSHEYIVSTPNSEPNNADEIATAIRTHSYLVIKLIMREILPILQLEILLKLIRFCDIDFVNFDRRKRKAKTGRNNLIYGAIYK
jgi:hypothetical protein